MPVNQICQHVITEAWPIERGPVQALENDVGMSVVAAKDNLQGKVAGDAAMRLSIDGPHADSRARSCARRNLCHGNLDARMKRSFSATRRSRSSTTDDSRSLAARVRIRRARGVDGDVHRSAAIVPQAHGDSVIAAVI